MTNQDTVREKIEEILKETDDQVIYDDREYISETGSVETGPTKLTYREFTDRRLNAILDLILQEKKALLERIENGLWTGNCLDQGFLDQLKENL